MNVLALIPARGGSKGIPRKNLAPLLGRPLINYSIRVASDSSLITRVIVSTDDEEIAGVSRECGAEIPFMRPAEYATDTATDHDVFCHVLRTLQEREGYRPDIVVQLRPTCPIRCVETVDTAIRQFIKGRNTVDSLRSVNVAKQTPYKMWRVLSDNLMEPLLSIPGIPEPYNTPRQKLPLVYWQNGYIDVTVPEQILDRGSMTGRKVMPFIIREKVFDIDQPETLAEAEQFLRAGNFSVKQEGEFPS